MVRQAAEAEDIARGWHGGGGCGGGGGGGGGGGDCRKGQVMCDVTSTLVCKKVLYRSGGGDCRKSTGHVMSV